MGFGDALRKGLDAHNQAVAARREMANILVEASRELTDVLGSEVTLRFAVLKRSAIENFAHSALGLEPRTYEADVLEFQKGTHRFKHIADVKFSEFGYPVQLKWDRYVEMASNAAEFKAAVERLLSSRSTGEKISWVMNGKEPGEAPPKAPEPQDQADSKAEPNE